MTVTGRHVQVSERFRRLCADKLAKVEQHERRAQRIEVIVSEETSRGAPKGSERVEITCVAKGPTIRAEAYAGDKYAALDLAVAKFTERMRRKHDRHKVSRRHGADPLAALDVARLASDAAPPVEERGADDADEPTNDPHLAAEGDCPVHVREKVHSSTPMSLDQALNNMELVGHDFYLFHDTETDRPSVVYRRRGWDYGVLRLDVVDAPAREAAPTPAEVNLTAQAG